jgi:hypothetical protein
MAEEKETAELSADEELSKAFDEYKEGKEEVEETTVTEPEKVEPPITTGTEAEPEGERLEGETLEQHKERSRAGRKLKGLKGFEEWQKQKDTEIEKLKEELQAVRKGHTLINQTPQEDEAELEEIRAIDDPIDRQRAITAYDEKKEKLLKARYEKEYMDSLQSITKTIVDDSELYDQVMALLTEERGQFNQIRKKIPDVDAQLNFEMAKAHVLSQKLAESKKPKYPGEGDTSTTIIAPAGTAKQTASKAISLPALDKETQDYVNYLRSVGTTEEEIAHSLGVK